jgi:DNA-binding response OmpR family regulator
MRELMARVKALLRRVRLIREEIGVSNAALAEAEMMVFDDLTINISRREVSLKDVALSLKPQEYELMLYLAQHRGRALSREALLENVWGWEYTGDSRTVDVHVRWLREKIEIEPANPRRIVTVRGVGYRFEG